MREILFRGQTRRYGEKVRMSDGTKIPSRWVYGGVLQGIGDFSVIYGGENANDPSEGLEKWTVYTDTLGQYTGLCDKNGKKIFEGDIVRTQPFSDRPYSKKAKFKQHIGVVEHSILRKYISEWSVKIENYDGFACCSWSAFYDCEVIGNIHDNPELLKGTEHGKE